MSAGALSAADLAEIEARGIEPREIERQIALHASPPPKIELDRPCTIGDGIEALDAGRAPELERLASETAAAGRVRVFIPASGAATRMFESLLAWPRHEPVPAAAELRRRAAAGDRPAADLMRVADEIESFAFHRELREVVARRGGNLASSRREERHNEVLRALLDSDGLALADLPKALVPFHHGEQSALTALEEQIAEAAGYACDATGVCRLHFTLAAELCRSLPQHRGAFRDPVWRARRDRVLAAGLRPPTPSPRHSMRGPFDSPMAACSSAPAATGRCSPTWPAWAPIW